MMLAAGIAVKFVALAAGRVAGNLASGIVPDVKLLALKAVKSIVSKDNTPLPFVFKNCPEDPSAEGKVNSTVADNVSTGLNFKKLAVVLSLNISLLTLAAVPFTVRPSLPVSYTHLRAHET